MKVGDELYAKNILRKTGYNVKIIKIGRKYFYVDILGEKVPFDIKTLRQKSTGVGRGYNWVLYDSEEEYNNVAEFNENWRKCVRDINSLSYLSKQKIIEIYRTEKDL